MTSVSDADSHGSALDLPTGSRFRFFSHRIMQISQGYLTVSFLENFCCGEKIFLTEYVDPDSDVH
jgi:hypothetical protein